MLVRIDRARGSIHPYDPVCVLPSLRHLPRTGGFRWSKLDLRRIAPTLVAQDVSNIGAFLPSFLTADYVENVFARSTRAKTGPAVERKHTSSGEPHERCPHAMSVN